MQPNPVPPPHPMAVIPVSVSKLPDTYNSERSRGIQKTRNAAKRCNNPTPSFWPFGQNLTRIWQTGLRNAISPIPAKAGIHSVTPWVAIASRRSVPLAARNLQALGIRPPELFRSCVVERRQAPS